ncbi:MAG: aromatic ring-hydroxylating dioxygenase subunit alpha [Alphaproteobacteria bacterium]|nr:aromatic ring-hydroxylating dioxygenase subunit alpha [Alphaproteobacteria bacterium]
MADQHRFLTETFSAYTQAEVPPIEENLQRVGPGTPGGEYLRRFWQPVAQSAMLKDLPVKIRIMGEDLVIFRDKLGRVGLLEMHCTHRGTSLEFGRIEDRGIRCCYHGWQFDIDGAILDTPAEPEKNPYKGKLYQGAYPTIEYRGLVFAYMGPPDKKPPFRKFDIFENPDIDFGLGEPLGGNLKPCNWLQVMDNVADPVHEAFLHASISGIQFTDTNGRTVEELADKGEDDYWETDVGVLCHVARRVKEAVWVRSMEYVIPNIIQICQMPLLPPPFASGEDELTMPQLLTRWRVPIDDENTIEFALVYFGRNDERNYVSAPSIALATNRGGRSYEEAQRTPGDYDAQVGQGPIARHGREHLGRTDRGVALMRRIVREGIEAVERGEDPKGLFRNGAIAPVYANETIRRASRGATPEEDRAIVRRVSHDLYRKTLASRPRTWA